MAQNRSCAIVTPAAQVKSQLSPGSITVSTSPPPPPVHVPRVPYICRFRCHLSFHPVFIAKNVQSEKRLPVFAPAQAPRAHPRGKARPPLRSNTQTSLVPPYPSVPRPGAGRPRRKLDAARSLVSSAAPDLRGMKTYLLVCIVWMLSVCPKPVLANKLGFRKENGKLKPFCSPWTP